jgi:hypothetical protein
MSRTPALARYLNPWKFKREQEELARVQALRTRDGEECRRCRRPLRFDLTSAHDLGPRIETVLSTTESSPPSLDNLCLTHRRCNGEGADNTRLVRERVRRKNEAELFANARSRRRA